MTYPEKSITTCFDCMQGDGRGEHGLGDGSGHRGLDGGRRGEVRLGKGFERQARLRVILPSLLTGWS